MTSGIDRKEERYTILERLGGGGMGVVYKARDLRLDRFVALKFLPPDLTLDGDAKARFINEAKAASSLQHNNICVVHDIDQTDKGQLFLVMEYYDGETLKSKLERGRFDPAGATATAMQLCQGLATAHENGIVHRDIKPANLMVMRDGTVKILDFGLAKLAGQQRLTRVGTTAGTAVYMSPEQVRGEEVDSRSDIWSVGAVLYEMLTGTPPFNAEYEQAIIYRILSSEPPDIVDIDPRYRDALKRIVHSALQKQAADRYQSIRDMLGDLGEAMAVPGETAAGTGEPRTRSPGSAGRRRPGRGWRLAAAGAGVVAIGVVLYALLSSPGGIRSLAVLPLSNPRGNHEIDDLCAGISENVIQSLSRVPAIRVKSAHAVLRYKDRPVDAEQAGKELDVEAVLVGEAEQRGDMLSVSVELIDARDNNHLWGSRLNRRTSEAIEIQEQITNGLLDVLRAGVSADQRERMESAYGANNEAYRLYTRGRYQWNKRTPEAILKGVAYFEQALAADPRHALAYTGIADSYNLLGSIEYGVMPPAEAMPRARSAAAKALELDEGLAEAHVSLGHVKFFYEWDWDGAIREYRRALELNPNYATAHQWYSDILLVRGRRSETLAEKSRALALEPASLIVTIDLGSAYYYWGEYDSALAQCTAVLEMDPAFIQAHLLRARCLVQKRMYGEAIAGLQAVHRAAPEFSLALALLGHAYGAAGMRDSAESTLAGLRSLAEKRYVGSHEFAAIHLGLGDSEKALDFLEKSLAERSGLMVYLNVEPVLEPLRREERFRELVRKVGL